MDTTGWLIDWFGERGPMPEGGRDALLGMNYFDVGIIDSLGVIELIAAVEAHFGIRFNQEDFQDRRFPSIGGLAALVDELAAQQLRA